VLDVGCGAGVTTRALVDAGFDVVALDPSAALLAHARRSAPGATLLRRSAYGEPLPAADAVIAIGEPLTYHDPASDADGVLASFFREVAHAIPVGGLFLFDLIDSEGPPLDSRGFRSAEDWVLVNENVEERAERRLVRHVETFVRIAATDTYRRCRETHHVRFFPEAEIRAVLDEVGFEVETRPSFGAAGGLPRRVAYCARLTGRGRT
jgi:SAM-dependent methyltransferase